MKYNLKINIIIKLTYFIKSIQYIIKDYLFNNNFFKEIKLIDLYIDNNSSTYTYYIDTDYSLDYLSNFISTHFKKIEDKIKMIYPEFTNDWTLKYDLE